QDDADDGALAATQGTASKHGRRDGIELIEIAVRRGRDRPRIHGKEDRRYRRQYTADHIGGNDDPAGCNARIPGGFLVLADREQMAAEYRAMQDDPHDGGDDNHGYKG